MCKWWWKIESDTGPWQHFMNVKYVKEAGVFYSKKKPGDSPLWIDMQKVKKNLYLSGRRMQVGDGKRTSLWCNAWCGLNPLKGNFP
jgi:hypothetical protein